MKQKITIKDVADLAGVSTTTVSFVFNAPARVKEETRRAVMEAAKRLNYTPNFSAGALRGKSTAVAVVFNFQHNEISHHPTFIEGFPLIAKYLMELGYYIMPFMQDPNDPEYSYLSALVKTRQLAGALFLGSRQDIHILDFLYEHRLPTVVIGSIEEYQGKLSFVDNDNTLDAERLTLKLYELGYRNIAYISGDLDYRVCRQRFKGYENAVLRAGFHPPLAAGFSENREILERSVEEILNTLPRPDAIITKDDIKGTMAVSVLHRLGFTVGKEIGVASIGPFFAGGYSYPAISMQQFSVPEIIEQAVNLLYRHMLNPSSPVENITISTDFHLRPSLIKR